MNKEELTTLPTLQGTSHCSCLEHCFSFGCSRCRVSPLQAARAADGRDAGLRDAPRAARAGGVRPPLLRRHVPALPRSRLAVPVPPEGLPLVLPGACARGRVYVCVCVCVCVCVSVCLSVCLSARARLGLRFVSLSFHRVSYGQFCIALSTISPSGPSVGVSKH